ncbi:MAG TPA: hypothetical protein VLL77_01430 [Anaerolineales bacterium]|nr:hypothetical protein [Anaerolineales bacterium]
MTGLLRPVVLVVGLFGSVWLGVFLARQLGEMLRTGFAGTMRWRFLRGRQPLQYWVLFYANVVLLLLVLVFLLVVVASLGALAI